MQICSWSTEWRRAKANRLLPRECTGQSKHLLPTTHEKTLHMDITRCQYRNQIDYLLCSQRWRSFIQLAKTKPGADRGSDRELLVAKFRLKLKKVRKFRYNLNSVGHSSITKIKSLMILQCKWPVDSRGLDLIDGVPEELWTEDCNIVQEAVTKTIPKKK